MAVGIAFDERGLALAHDVFAGNIAETKTLAQMLGQANNMGVYCHTDEEF